MHIVIMGAGIAGLCSALALTKHLPDSKPKITIVEVRSTPSTIGGAVNLTPKALRYLAYLGVYKTMVSKGYGADCQTIDLFDINSGSKFAEVSFRGPEGRGIGKERNKEFFSRRVMRWQIQEVLLHAVKAQANTVICWGKKAVKIEEPRPAEGVHLTFEDGDELKCDLLLGCDGIHSATRTLLVEPSRHPTYTGICTALTTSKVRSATQLKWETTGLTSSRKGSFMASYFDNARQDQYIGVVMEVAEVASREGWKLRGSDQNAIKADILERFECDTMPELAELIEDAGTWTLYPVYRLPSQGQWSSSSCILLGDAAHAMPPQGESTGICIEDAIIFSRCMIHHERGLSAVFAAYEKVRRTPIEQAVSQAVSRWETVKDKGWLFFRIVVLLTPWILWWTAKERDEEFAQDWSEAEIEV